eukprot:1938550-Pleurochrysis_carterae.AAC.2
MCSDWPTSGVLGSFFTTVFASGLSPQDIGQALAVIQGWVSRQSQRRCRPENSKQDLHPANPAKRRVSPAKRRVSPAKRR